MEIQIPLEQQTIVEGLVATGRFSSVHEAISEGIRLLVSNETLRQEIHVGIEQADRNELIDHDSVFAQLRTMAAASQATDG